MELKYVVTVIHNEETKVIQKFGDETRAEFFKAGLNMGLILAAKVDEGIWDVTLTKEKSSEA